MSGTHWHTSRSRRRRWDRRPDSIDGLAHEHADRRWLATGGGGYDAYRVVPRAWALVWLAGAHQDVPAATPMAWRERWSEEAARYGQAPLPGTFTDPPIESDPAIEAAVERVVERSRALVLPLLEARRT